MRLDIPSFVAKHDLLITTPTFPWTTGLPVGNGLFGGLVYQPEGRFEWSLNRLEVSQAMTYGVEATPLDTSLPLDAEGRPIDHARVMEFIERGDWEGLDALFGNPFVYGDREAESPAPFPAGFAPVAAWLRLIPRLSKREIDRLSLEAGPDEGFQARLDLTAGQVLQRLPTPTGPALLTSYVCEDPAVYVVRAEGPGLEMLVKSLELARPALPVALPDPQVTVEALPRGVRYSVEVTLPQNNFRWAVAAQINGGEWEVSAADGVAQARPTLLQGGFTFLASLVTSLDSDDPLAAAQEVVETASREQITDLGERHRRWWHDFWSRSAIETEDAFLDGLWYTNLYALASSNGRDSRFPTQAAGISGLWQATDQLRWGNNWVLDVNIQEAYSPCYATNHVDLARPFELGIEAQVPAARSLARRFFGLEGLAFGASGYYGPYYHCSGPWYCLYLWMRYDYQPDEAYLREIYPVLGETCRFYEQYLREENGRLVMWPSNEPENQSRRMGPDSGWVMTTRNPAIDLPLLRHLLRTTAQAADLLATDSDRAVCWREMAEKIADFTLVDSPLGTVIADSESELPPDEVELRHASRLMAVWPVGEVGLDSDPDWQQIWRQTVHDTAARAEIVPHTLGWIAAAAARLGQGDFAARHLYEKGLEPMLMPNGMFSEETPRGLQELNIDVPPLPNQPLLEGGSSTVAALCEMLVQGHGDRVRLFPALPSDTRQARFAQLRTSGGFLVSAALEEGEVAWGLIEPTASGPCTVVNPWGEKEMVVAQAGVEVVRGKGEVTFAAEAGAAYLLRRAGDVPAVPETMSASSAAPTVRHTHVREGMHVWLGWDAEAEFWSSVESFLGRYWNGNQRQSRHIPYRFQFGRVQRERTLELFDLLPARHRVHNMVNSSFRILAPQTTYHPNREYGWVEQPDLEVVAGDGPDALRREGLASATPATLRLDLPAGVYALMFVLGSSEEETWPQATVAGQTWQSAEPLLPGRWATPVLAVSLQEAGSVAVAFEGTEGKRWACSGLFVRKM